MSISTFKISNTGSQDIYVIPSSIGHCSPSVFPVQAPVVNQNWCPTAAGSNCPTTLVSADCSREFTLPSTPIDGNIGLQIFPSAISNTPIWQGSSLDNTDINFNSDTNIVTYDDGTIVPPCPFSPPSPPPAQSNLFVANTGNTNIYVISSKNGHCNPSTFPVVSPVNTTWCTTSACTNVLVAPNDKRGFITGNPPDGVLGVQIFNSPSNNTPIWQGSVTNNSTINYNSDTNTATYNDGSTVQDCTSPKPPHKSPPEIGGISEETWIYIGIGGAIFLIILFLILAFRRK